MLVTSMVLIGTNTVFGFVRDVLLFGFFVLLYTCSGCSVLKVGLKNFVGSMLFTLDLIVF